MPPAPPVILTLPVADIHKLTTRQRQALAHYAAQCYKAELSIRDITDITGVSYNTVRNDLIAARVLLRGRGGAQANVHIREARRTNVRARIR